MKRRNFAKNIIAVSGVVGALPNSVILRECTNSVHNQQEVLYNGVVLQKKWPPTDMSPTSYAQMPVPYLKNPPDIIPIHIGRQLFIDDFLIEETTLERKFHSANKIENNPILTPRTAIERGKYGHGQSIACPKDGGVWWDPKDKLFKMWYEAGWIGTMAFAISKDGINWERPDLDLEKGTNRILPAIFPDSTTVFLDHDTDNPNERFKMFLREPNSGGRVHGFCMVSADGVHWNNRVPTGFCGDRSTMFYNPFRKRWIYSIRNTKELGESPHGRSRFYHEHSDFLKGADWNEKVVFWTGADKFDIPDPEIGDPPQLYNLSGVGYESIMLGLHQIHLGPHNRECVKMGTPKITELMVSFSRDGFHWHRPERKAFIPATRNPGDWDRGYVQSVGGICTILGDEMRFYFTGFEGDTSNTTGGMRSGMYANGSTGIAVLRRDGFASMEAQSSKGDLITRKLIFRGRYLFINVDCPLGEFKVEILNEKNQKIDGFSQADCVPISENSTIQRIEWKSGGDISALQGTPVRFRFSLQNGKLYSFWVSPSESGASYGYNAGGGPGFKGGTDKEGLEGYTQSNKYSKLLEI